MTKSMATRRTAGSVLTAVLAVLVGWGETPQARTASTPLLWQGRLGSHQVSLFGTIHVPDFVKLADAYGAVGLRCETTADVDATIKRAMEIDDQPVVVDFTVSRASMVWPMVAAGVSNDEIQYARGISPAWDRED